MSIATIIGNLIRDGKNRSSPATNCSKLLEEGNEDLLVMIPRSKYMLKCRERDEGGWMVDLLDSTTMYEARIHKNLDTAHFQALLYNIFSIKPDNVAWYAVKEMYRGNNQ